MAVWLIGASVVAGELDIESDVVEATLDNGLTVLVLEDRRAPVVANMVWYRVGSADEHSGITGISHMLEHMMFRGTEKYEPGEFSRIVARMGGRENAFTGRDYTGYHQVIGSDHWETVMAMEAERMQHLKLQEDEFRPELRVVQEERRLRVEDQPNALLREQLMATAFFNHPYGQPVIGWMTDIESYTLEDLQDWYDRYYHPNNAVVVVVGDVDADEVIAAAEKHFGSIPSGNLPEAKPRRETPQTGERRITVQAPAQVPFLMMGWKAPVLNTLDSHEDAYALLVAAGILDSGEASRFARELVRGQELASATSARYSPFGRLDDLFMVAAVPASGTDIESLEQALLDEIDRLAEEPVDDRELERVQARVIASEVYERDSVRAQAFQLGMLETVGVGWRENDRFLERVREVTAEDVQRVVREYLVPERRTVGILDPQPMDDEDTPAPGPYGAPDLDGGYPEGDH
ncbi:MULTISPECIES: pitrilysin family protein [unclassified Thioalkalivibrio]|uniref:M16 family metallopeptidase n=1 Tax=unclassified Thioalkalivibrio TaxID=2621013 RepID=UPI00036F7713|nr:MULTISPECIES: pitrilysin family protein [unclassified Thioalkalivibrio]